MVQRLCLLLFLLIFCNYSFSQEDAETLSGSEDSIASIDNSLKSGDLRKNSVYIELGGTGGFWTLLSYDRIIPISHHIAFVPRIGFGIYDEFYPVYELNFVFGKRHFFETGFGQYMFFNTFPEKDFMIRAGYRYQGRKGLLIRLAPQLYRVYSPEPDDKQLGFWFGLSLGYSF